MPGGRIAEAARNDRKILESARAVFVADPEAPIAAVAKHAGVGIGALYRRYDGKEALLRALCADGLRRYIEAAESALADEQDPWDAFAAFMRREVDADASSLTQRLAGTFTPTPELYAAAARAGELNVALFSRAQEAGAIRPDASVNDLGPILEQLASLQIGDADRARELRHRYLTLFLDGLRTTAEELPAPAPSDDELQERWRPS
ncbi:MAG: TetR/AcrR family transcriptional regulator [Thermoleophilia bacterium]|nr:TetR/AcrR family transcriptional regulator [Thermoleophilia bacterium]